ncbi:ImmA/IrrE family metallo-endopeptidase [Leptospira santarosai]|uniref:ImmA/IrrE family metallo-endopeptidase n=1 Tax=Leptospira santarosai TaxID=28183 RepID=UPI00029850E7|nr:ImmA/IrrE family metallo-endopeptidase [Leptospira santarosai]EKS09279.1 PF06114 domain protein [Leptospira santarosai str. JET]
MNIRSENEDIYVYPNQIRIDILENYEYLKKSNKIKQLIELGIISPANPDRDLLILLAKSPDGVLFRATESADEVITKLWLSKVIIKATEVYSVIPNLNFDKSLISIKFMKNFAKYSKSIRSLNEIEKLLREKGVLLIYESYIKGSKIDGACLTLPNGIPVIAVTMRYDRLDSFWFTLLHELAHIHLHYEYLKEPIVDDLENESQEKFEKQANLLAKFSIVEKSEWRTFIAECRSLYFNSKKSEEMLKKFSDHNGVHPALVAGLLRHELKNYVLYSEIVNSIEYRNLLEIEN